MKIVRREIPAAIVYEDEHTLAFLDNAPVSKGHTLVIPKQPVRNVFDAGQEAWTTVMETVRKLAPIVRDAVGADGVHINSNHEPEAGQKVFHLHVHIIPRTRGDAVHFWPTIESSDAEREATASAIRERLA